MDSTYAELRRTLEAFVRPTADHKQAQKREHILSAATQSFVAHGYRKTSVDDVARAAGVAKGTVYLYYANKAELLVHAIAAEQLHYLAAFKPMFDESMSPTDRLRTFIAVAIIWSSRLPLLAKFSGGDHEFALVLRDIDGEFLERVSSIEVAFVTRLLDDALGHRLPEDSLRHRAEALLELVFALVTGERLMHTDLQLEPYARLMADVLVLGVTHQPERADPLDLLDERGEPGQNDRRAL